MSKFYNNLIKSNNEIKETRAKRVSEQAEMAQQELVNRIKKELNQLENQLEDIYDLAPDNTQSLNVGKNFDAEQWVQKVQDLKIQFMNKEVELKAANETLNEWFKPEK